MHHIRLKTLIMAALALFHAASTEAADITGQWKAEFDTQIGRQKYLFDLKPDGGKVTGKATSEVNGDKHTAELKDGKLKGGEVRSDSPYSHCALS